MTNKRKYKDYPRIYSISTVGIIKHNNSDYLIHPLRTDFTGGSGAGKSLITDLLQLILVGRKTFWKSPSEDNDSTTEEKREVRTLVLNTGDFPIGYTFINIETSENQFITIGTFIKRNNGDIYPFIIQQGISWEIEKNKLQSFPNFLTHKDFLIDNKIPKISILKEHFDNNLGLQLKHFYNNTVDFHKLLYLNDILHIDLSKKDEYLQSYAEVLQYFGRGKAFDKYGSRSNQIKNFLFVTDNKDKEEEYQKQKKQIEKSQRQYVEQFKISERVKKRRDKLLDLLDDKLDYNKKQHEALWTESVFYYNKQRENQSNLISTKKDLAVNQFQILKFDHKYNALEINEIYKEIEELQKSKSEKEKQKKKAETKKSNATKQTDLLKTKKDDSEKEFFKQKENHEKIERVEKLLNSYHTINKVEEQFDKQAEIESQKQNINNFIEFLNTNNLTSEFKNSQYFLTTYNKAETFYSQKVSELKIEIESLEKLKPLFDKSHKKSFAQWIVNNLKKLSKQEEEILFHFKDKSISRPEHIKSGERYIAEPDKIFKNIQPIDKNDEGFWINLNGIYEFVESIKEENLIFNNPKTLQQELDKFGEDITMQINKKNADLEAIMEFQEKLKKYVGFNQEICELYKNKKTILGFHINTDLQIHRDEFKKLIEFYKENKPENIKKNYENSTREYETATTNFQNNETEIKKLTDSINSLADEIDKIENKIEEKNNQEDSELAVLINNQEKIENKLKSSKSNLTIEDKINSENYSFENPLNSTEKIELEREIETEITKIQEENSNKTNSIKRKLQELANKHREEKGTIESNILFLIKEQPKIEQALKKSETEYEKYTKKVQQHPVDTKISKKISDNQLKTIKEDYKSAKINYETKFDTISQDPDLQIENDVISNLNYDFSELVKILLPDVFKNSKDIEQNLKKDIEIELKNINAKITEFARTNFIIIQNLFGDVEEQYEKYLDKISDLKDFFVKNRAAGNYYVEMEPRPSDNYPIKWIKVLKQKVKNEIYNTGLFKTAEAKSADQIIEETFKEFSQLKNAKPTINKLLDPKSYFDINIYFKDPNDENAPPSTGQGYAILALLNIAKLSLIDTVNSKQGENPKGLRYMPIDEVAGLGENFDMLYDIAEKYDYQILTMTINSNDHEFENNNQYSYTLRKNPNPKDPNRNLAPFGIFSKYQLIESLSKYIEKIKHEGRN